MAETPNSQQTSEEAKPQSDTVKSSINEEARKDIINRYRRRPFFSRIPPDENSTYSTNKKFSPTRSWRKRFIEIDSRLFVYSDLFKIYDRSLYPYTRKLILIDIMLDKTQTELVRRAYYYFIPGITLLIFTIASLVLFAFYLTFSDAFNCLIAEKSLPVTDGYKTLVSNFCTTTPPKDWMEFALTLFKRTVIGGALLAVVYVFFANAKACFRESTRLLHRRHSVRYIRLLLYNNNGNLSNTELRDAFGIDDVTTSGFDDIKTEVVLNNLVGRLIDQIGKIKAAATSRDSDPADFIKNILSSIKQK